jgi:hypothetical protein
MSKELAAGAARGPRPPSPGRRRTIDILHRLS